MGPTLRVLAVAAYLVAGTAFAQSSGGAAADLKGPGGLTDGSPHRRQRMITVSVGFPYLYYGWGGVGFPFGAGVSYFQPLLHDGFVPNLNDSFNLEVGANLAFAYGGGFSSWLAIPLTVNWALHFTPEFAGYLKLGAGFNFTFGYWSSRGVFSAFPVGGLGILVKLNQTLTLRVEAGYPWLSVGLGFAF
ncbi:MAG: hypothetical protein AB1938_29260 [Myxococcota bacterium]